MCASCGCGKYQEDHGDDRHITLTDLEEAAEAADVSVTDVVNNLKEAATSGTTEKAATPVS